MPFITVLEPVLHPLRNRWADLLCGFIQHLAIRFQIGPQPVESLLTKASDVEFDSDGDAA